MSQDPSQATEVKPDPSDPNKENNTINVKVVSATGDEVFFKIKRTTKLSKLQGAYASKVGKDVGSIRFLYDGTRINVDDTPDSLDMEDNGVFPSHISSFVHPVLIDSLYRHYRRDGRTYVAFSPLPPLPEPSLILGPIISRGWRVPAAVTPPTPPFPFLVLSILPSTHTSVPPANRLFAAPAHSLC
ncbi:ubiquitin-related domain-containing protein [Lactarius quietus]|nr:ubiquitin-related domain-containing protein [Lactarius quietus]